MTKTTGRVLRLAATLLLAGATVPAAAQSASFLVVHGIPGRDVAAGLDPKLPVDVKIAGSVCLLKNFTFGDIAGPYDVPAGTYSVAVSLANPVSPCSNDPVISADVTLTAGQFGAVVAQLNAAGAPSAGVFPIDVSALAKGRQRIVVAHAAKAPTVTVTGGTHGVPAQSFSFTLNPGQAKTQGVLTRLAASAAISAGGNPVAQTTVKGLDRDLFFIVAVGNATSGSVRLLSTTIPNVF